MSMTGIRKQYIHLLMIFGIKKIEVWNLIMTKKGKKRNDAFEKCIFDFERFLVRFVSLQT